ncbi:solute carrier family 25 member 51 [Brachionus plicatilis]|uniref:Solute carrier family 25 member 51 n=1 Tax=Brachionus plicatilis TaxID=10195 RepID=A0A3M7T1H4_BRAPC|nr:solute carrier family 25 member 51 [Brachionus plicatilis]
MEKVNHELKTCKFLTNNSSPAKQSNVVNKSKYVFSSHAEFVSGYIAACTSITVLFPLNKLIFRQILHGSSFRDAFLQLKDEGFGRVYRGLLPPLLQKSFSYSIMFGTQNEYSLWLRLLYEQSDSARIRQLNPSLVSNFITAIAGGMAGLTEAFLTPLERVQSVLQMQQYHHRYKHTWHVFYDVNKIYGFRELYRGLTVICLRNSLSNMSGSIENSFSQNKQFY